MFDRDQLAVNIIRPTLKHIGYYSPEAEQLLLGTAAQESQFGKYLVQIKGPAVGIYQMEPFTHDDLWVTTLKRDKALAKKVTELKLDIIEDSQEMAGNLYYATAMARVFYLRIREKLPEIDDTQGQAIYWKKYYNTYLGAGIIQEYLDNYMRYVA